MEPRLAANYRHFTMVTPHETRVVHPHAMPYGSYDEDTMALVLALPDWRSWPLRPFRY